MGIQEWETNSSHDSVQSQSSPVVLESQARRTCHCFAGLLVRLNYCAIFFLLLKDEIERIL